MIPEENKCVCGNAVKDKHANALNPSPSLTANSNNRDYANPLEASFVHLALPSGGSNQGRTGFGFMQGRSSDEGDLFNTGILDSYRHNQTLLEVAECHLDIREEGNDLSDVCLCSMCVERIASAIEDNTARLRAETGEYDRAMEMEQENQKRLLKALSINAGIHHNTDEDSNNEPFSEFNEQEILQNALDTLEYEWLRLRNVQQEHQRELDTINNLLEEQTLVSQTLTSQEDEVLTEFSSLEVDARVFQDIHRHLTHQCHAAEREKFHLSRVQLHSSLFHIVVDERGLRFPLINNLRLAHKPMGLSWLEINAAWSQAAQLLMFIGSTIKFKSRNLRIVPLMSCAKIIVGVDTNVVHNLGVDLQAMDKKTHNVETIIPSIRAFHALLHQMTVHIKNSNLSCDLGKVPFNLGHHIIGSHDLKQMHHTDDVGWSTIIHCMALHMQWMSKIACRFMQ